MPSERVMLVSVMVVLIVVLLTAILALAKAQSSVTQEAITTLIGLVVIVVGAIGTYIARGNGGTK